MTDYKAKRMCRAVRLAAEIHRLGWLKLGRAELIDKIERAGPADLSDMGPHWRMRCWGFAASSTAGPHGAVANWCEQVERKAKAEVQG